MRVAFLIQVPLGGSPLWDKAALGRLQRNSQLSHQEAVKSSQPGKLEVGMGKGLRKCLGFRPPGAAFLVHRTDVWSPRSWATAKCLYESFGIFLWKYQICPLQISCAASDVKAGGGGELGERNTAWNHWESNKYPNHHIQNSPRGQYCPF